MKTRLWITAVILLALVLLPASRSSVQAARPTVGNPVYLPLVTGSNTTMLSFYTPASIHVTPLPTNGQLYMVVDSSGQAHIFWSNSMVYHVILKNTGFTTPENIMAPYSSSRLIKQPMAGKNNDIHLVFSATMPIGAPYYIVYQKWDGAQWGPQNAILSGATVRDVTGAVRLNSQGNPMIFGRVQDILDPYYETQSRDYWYQEWSGAGFGSVQTMSSKFTNAQYEYTFIDKNGGLRLYLTINKNIGSNELHYAYWKNGAWVVPDQIITTPASGSVIIDSALMDNQNNLHFFTKSQSGSNVSLYHQCLQNNLAFDAYKSISGTDNVTSSAWSLDDNASPVSVYQTSTNVTLQSWNGCQIAKQVSFVLPTPPSGSSWGGITAVGWNQQARKACLLIGDSSGFQKSLVLCMDL